MFKRNKGKIILSSFIILLPMALSLIVKQFTDKDPGLFFSVGMPLFSLVTQFVCIYFTDRDPGNKEQSKKAESIIIFMVPFLSLYTFALYVGILFGINFLSTKGTVLIFFVIFILLGNQMPRLRRNSTFGIKVRWAMTDDENWRLTHRFGGRVYVLGGVALLLTVFLPISIFVPFFVILLLVICFAPVAYSYIIYRKQKSGAIPYSPVPPSINMSPGAKKAVILIVVLILAAVCVLLFTGDLEVSLGDTALSVKASWYEDYSLPYDSIAEISLRDDFDAGLRTFGFGSPRLLMGNFKNDEVGNYTRYSYTDCPYTVVITTKSGSIVALSGKDKEETEEIYNILLEKIK